MCWLAFSLASPHQTLLCPSGTLEVELPPGPPQCRASRALLPSCGRLARTCVAKPGFGLAYMHIQKTGGEFGTSVLRVTCTALFNRTTGQISSRFAKAVGGLGEERLKDLVPATGSLLQARECPCIALLNHKADDARTFAFHRPYNARRDRSTVVALFRDPRARVASAFFFGAATRARASASGRAEVFLPAGFRRSITPADAARLVLRQPNAVLAYARLPGMAACQTKMVLGVACGVDRNVSDAERREAARRVREDFAFVGLQDKWAQSTELFARMFGLQATAARGLRSGEPRRLQLWRADRGVRCEDASAPPLRAVPIATGGAATHTREGGYDRQLALRNLTEYHDPDDEETFRVAREVFEWRCAAFGVGDCGGVG